MDTVKRGKISPQKVMIVGLIISLLAASGEGSHLGIGGDADGKGEVPMAGCTCHSAQPDNSVTIILDGVPYHYQQGKEYQMKIQIIGGPEINSESYTGGFSMKASLGQFTPGPEFDGLVQNWEDDPSTMTHTGAGSATPDRTWHINWIAPAESNDTVTFWLAGNSVNGDMAPSELDKWNRLTASVDEGEDNGRFRAIFSGNGDINPPSPIEEKVDLHHMGAKLKAHWLGLLGFGAVALVILFCGLFLRYGFSRHYSGRSNLLKLRIKHLRRGDQI